jgi:hypothetical protein
MIACPQTQCEMTSCPQLLLTTLLLVPRHRLQNGGSSHVLQLPLFILMAAGDGIRCVAYATALHRTPARCVQRVTLLPFCHLHHTMLDRFARNSRLYSACYGAFSSRVYLLARVSTTIVARETK